MIPTLSSLVVLEVVMMATTSGTSENKVWFDYTYQFLEIE